jgi:glycosyltransferase involved in cell wall biosynthesis
VIGFDTSSWILVDRCRSIGVPLILDQTIGHPDAKISAFQLVREQYPEWNVGIDARRPEVRAAEQIEHDLASLVVAGSSFVRDTLISHGVDAGKVRVNHYGVDCGRFNIVGRRSSSRPFRFLFVGTVNARKGIPLLLDSWKRLVPTSAELWVAGSAEKSALSLLEELPGLKYLGQLPHGEIPHVMNECDAFVFPTYFEGLALVNLEAMACGLPVITTSASGASDVITNGVDGWITEPGDLSSLMEVMTFCLERPSVVREMGAEARRTAECFSWSAYGDRWMRILAEVSN